MPREWGHWGITIRDWYGQSSEPLEKSPLVEPLGREHGCDILRLSRILGRLSAQTRPRKSGADRRKEAVRTRRAIESTHNAIFILVGKMASRGRGSPHTEANQRKSKPISLHAFRSGSISRALLNSRWKHGVSGNGFAARARSYSAIAGRLVSEEG